jgi:hypothetical protein
MTLNLAHSINWDAYKHAAETVESVLKSIAILVAGFWAYWKFFLQAEHETSISSKLHVTVLPCQSNNLRMIEVRSTLTNHGRVPCQIDLAHSRLRVARVVVTADTQKGQLTWHTTPYFTKLSLESDGLLNVPVGAAKDEVQFVPVPHPGVYHVRTFFAQTERAVRQFYRRMRQPLPVNYRDNPSGWSNEIIVSTDTSSMSAIREYDESASNGV